MNKSTIFSAITAAIALSAGAAFASASTAEMEKCMPMMDGKGLIMEHKADCKTSSHSCAGQNQAGDPMSWIMVPKGDCAKINAGDFKNVDPSVLAKLEMKK